MYLSGVIIVAIVFLSVLAIVRMSLEHHENIERIRHGYPVKENGKNVHKNNYIDVTDRNVNNRQQ